MAEKIRKTIRYQFPDGDIYVGEAVDDTVFDGKGKYTYAKGDVYEGEFANGKRNGKGKFLYADGSIYEGEFLNDLFNGEGTYTNADGISYTGIWENDECIVYRISEKFKDIYEGELDKGFPHGKGKLVEDGIVYEGTFIQGVKNGHFIEYPKDNPKDKKDVLYNCGHRVNLFDYHKKFLDKGYDDYHMVSSKNIGNCLKLTGQVTIVVVYADDGESSWNYEDKELYRREIFDSLDHLEKSAKEYGVDLDFSVVEKEDKYTNVIKFPQPDSFYEEYYSKIEMYKNITEDAMKTEETNKSAVLLMFNKEFRSYSHAAKKGNVHYEVAFIGAKYPVKNQIAHELLHLFGAKDLYRPEEMRELAKIYYPISIMLEVSDVFLPVDEVTAYLVGWADGLSDRAARFVKRTHFIRISPEQKIDEKADKIEKFGLQE